MRLQPRGWAKILGKLDLAYKFATDVVAENYILVVAVEEATDQGSLSRF